MNSSENEFTFLVNKYRRLVEKYAGGASEASSRRVRTTCSTLTSSTEDLQLLHLTSPFNTVWSTSLAPENVAGRNVQTFSSLCGRQEAETRKARSENVGTGGPSEGLQASDGTEVHLGTALSRILDGLKESTSATQTLQSANSSSAWTLRLASLDYAKSLVSFSCGKEAETRCLSSRLPPGASLGSSVDGGGLMQTTQRSKRKDFIDGRINEARPESFPVKRPRLVWTEDLHKCFEDAVEKLGLAKATPKAILEEMNVEGLTRENVASHLQKYRDQLNLKSKQNKRKSDWTEKRGEF